MNQSKKSGASLALSFIILTSLCSFAGIRIVGKGGGFAEMQAYAFDKSFPALLQFCDQRPEVCLLDAKERTAIRQLLSQKNLLTSDLIINTTCTSPFIHPIENAVASIDACLFYLKETGSFGPEPKSLNDIGSIILFARFSALSDSALNALEIKSLSQKILKDLEFQNQPYLLSPNGFSHRLNLWSFSAFAQEKKFISLESYQTSYDLTQQLQKTLACDHSDFAWNLNEILTYPSNAGHSQLQGNITWSCQGQRYQAVLSMDLSFQNETFQSIQFVLLGREQL